MPRFVKLPRASGFVWIDLDAVTAVDVDTIGGQTHRLSFKLRGAGIVEFEKPQDAEQALAAFEKYATETQWEGLKERGKKIGLESEVMEDVRKQHRATKKGKSNQQSPRAPDAG